MSQTTQQLVLLFAQEDANVALQLQVLLLRHLSGRATVWSPRQLLAGDNRSATIASKIDRADILLLLGPDKLQSEWIERAIGRNDHSARVVSVRLRPAPLRSELEALTPLPLDGTHIFTSPSLDAALLNVVTGILELPPRPASRRTTPQPGGSAATATNPAATSPATTASAKGAAMPDPKKVFIIHGRNTKARNELGIFVRSLGLSPINFMDLRASMGGTPTVAEIVERGMDQAQGVIALVTADEYAAVRPDLRYAHDQPDDIARWQARPNVIFEAGMAFGRDRKRVVFVLLGNPKLFTDVAGIHILRPNNDPSSDRVTLRNALSQGMGCEVDLHSSDWMTSGDFVSCAAPLPGVSPQDPFAVLLAPSAPSA
jgi:predicted nucleotide-binding protein